MKNENKETETFKVLIHFEALLKPTFEEILVPVQTEKKKWIRRV